ncbi:MAG: sigma-70 family RNA polymerase sigma factor [Prevotella sp.]|nr:sigma-70 family RNA polymerase sigma factor [Prevotella sp.]
MSKYHAYSKEFESLFRKWYTPVYYRALDWVEDEEVAKDLVSELFADVWSSYGQIRQYRMPAYLFTAIRNKSINHLEHLKVERNYQTEYLRMKQEVIGDSELLERRMELMEQVIGSQTPLTRLVFEQCCYEGKSYQQVAEMLDVSVSAIHKHVSKMMAALRAALLSK